MRTMDSHKRWTSIGLCFALAFQLLTGTGFFCAFKPSRASLPSGISPAAIASDKSVSNEVASKDGRNGAADKGNAVPCACKKQKKCPVIPRLALASYPMHRLNEIERLVTVDCGYNVVPDSVDYRFAVGGGPPSSGSESEGPFRSSSPLETIGVLLI